MEQVWATNETSVVLSGMLSSRTLDMLLENKKAFGDLDQERMVGTQLLALKMMVVMMAEEYMAKFEMLSGRTWFNKTTLEDVYIQSLPHWILSKVYSQTTLPSD